MLPRPVIDCDGAEDLVVLWNVRREPSVRTGASSCRGIIWCEVPRRKVAERAFSALVSDMITAPCCYASRLCSFLVCPSLLSLNW